MVCKAFVIGMGMGNPDLLTVRARDALARSELIVGSRRLLAALDGYAARKVEQVLSREIARELRESEAGVASVVLSGDIGLYSGAAGLFDLLEGMEVEAIPGISSLSYLCAKLHVPWQDVRVVSAHGRVHNLAGVVQSCATTFVLAGGHTLPQDLCSQLVARGLGDVEVSVGERLSYEDERITCGPASKLARESFDQLSVMLVLNEHPLRVTGVPHLTDDAFIRGTVPMTKEEVRELVVCKLRVRPHDVVWDVGAGTGSVSVELARAAYEGLVVSVERNSEAVGLVSSNKERFGLPNLQVVTGEAPEALVGLPAADCVFVGGSSGHLEGILTHAVRSNPTVRLCVSAITLETVGEALRCVDTLGLRDVDIVQVAISKAREVGRSHMLRARNPVFLICANGPRGADDADEAMGHEDAMAGSPDGGASCGGCLCEAVSQGAGDGDAPDASCERAHQGTKGGVTHAC